jgi:hypothetical protein
MSKGNIAYREKYKRRKRTKGKTLYRKEEKGPR